MASEKLDLGFRSESDGGENSQVISQTEKVNVAIKNRMSPLFICVFCNKQFESLTLRNDHHKSHPGVKQVLCQFFRKCKSSFDTKEQLLVHLDKHHSIEGKT